MKIISIVVIVFLLFAVMPDNGFAQLKKDSQPPNLTGILSMPQGDAFLSFLDPSKFHMSHAFSMSYGAMGSQGMMLSSYMNTIDHQFSETLSLRTNLGVMTSPYNTYGENFFLNKPQLFGGAQLKYQIDEDSSVLLRFEMAPAYYYRPTFGPGYYNRFNSQFE